MDFFSLQKSFLHEYIELYSWAFPRKVIDRLRQRWFFERAENLGYRRTTSVELYEYDFELLDSIPPAFNLSGQSQKIRFAIRLGVLAYHYGWDRSLPFGQEVVEQILKLNDGEFEAWILEDLEELGKKRG